ncbi:MAG: hypothetical protein EBS39_06935 [Gammaproteobacteria bacterium]|nr:hypothetical protein [Gammaproteobacteria bacterium]
MSYAWPNGARLALSLVVNVEEGAEFNVTDGDRGPDPVDELGIVLKKPVRNHGNESNYAYGINEGAPRVLGLLARYDMPATFTAAAVALERAPQVAAGIVAGEHEVCAHGYRWAHQLGMPEEREREEVSRTIGELQAEVARQRQQLDLYRGVVTGGSPATASVAIRRLQLAPSARPGGHLLRIALARTGRPEREVAGTVKVDIEGSRNGRQLRLGLQETTSARAAQLTYRFLYFENLEVEIALPAGFRPERVLVEVRPAERGAAPVTRTLLWAIDGSATTDDQGG